MKSVLGFLCQNPLRQLVGFLDRDPGIGRHRNPTPRAGAAIANAPGENVSGIWLVAMSCGDVLKGWSNDLPIDLVTGQAGLTSNQRI